eukprot:3156484-Rhodomonas_salina.1
MPPRGHAVDKAPQSFCFVVKSLCRVGCLVKQAKEVRCSLFTVVIHLAKATCHNRCLPSATHKHSKGETHNISKRNSRLLDAHCFTCESISSVISLHWRPVGCCGCSWVGCWHADASDRTECTNRNLNVFLDWFGNPGTVLGCSALEIGCKLQRNFGCDLAARVPGH